ncbi:Molybdopterin synthase catalytic subunit [Cichlidogyrus casuarinus]|uniref:Molybdopterin synthase catalytic subunit n=1 Tax=Cichlidogyrus casuarinus TaxID=1844966 RepID=A0ABD2PSU1_9PLAT
MSEIPVSILFFAKSAELTGIKETNISIPSSIKSVGNLLNFILSRWPELVVLNGCFVFAINCVYVELKDPDIELNLQSGSEIAIIPPISGG